MTTATEAKPRTEYRVGDRVTITRACRPEQGALIATVTERLRDTNGSTYGPKIKFDGPAPEGTWGGGEWYVEPQDTITPLDSEPTEPEPVPTVSREEYDIIVRRLTAANERTDRMLRDVRTLGSSLAEAADDNDLCEQYERSVQEILPHLSDDGFRDTFEESATRNREYEVCVHLSATTTVTITARSEDEATELVRDDVWSYVDTYSLRDEAEVDEVHID